MIFLVIIIEYLIVSVLLGSGCIAGGTVYAHTSGVYEHWSFGSPHAWNWFMWFRMSLRWVKDRMNTHTHTHTLHLSSTHAVMQSRVLYLWKVVGQNAL